MKKGILSVISLFTGVAAGAGVVKKVEKKNFDKMKELADRHLALFLLMNQWVKVKQEGKKVASYLEENGYRKIAIYGMSYVGETLLDELKESSVQVAYGIDRKGDTLYTDVDIVTLEDDLEEVDAVVVTAITFFDEISRELDTRVDCPILSLEDILFEM